MTFEKLVGIEEIKIDEKEMILAYFSTPSGWIGGSAVCIFSLEELNKVWQSEFESGNKIKPHPGTCPRKTPKENIKFVSQKENHQLLGKIRTYKNQGMPNYKVQK